MSSPFKMSLEQAQQFNATLHTEAKGWDPGIDLDAADGSRSAYVSASAHLTRLVMPFLSSNLQSRGVAILSGLQAASCFAYTTALHARHEGLSQAELYERAKAPASYQSMLLPAKTINSLAVSIEDLTGMRPTDWHSEETKLSHYESSANGFAFKDPELVADTAAYYGNIHPQFFDEGVPTGRCPAPRYGMVRYALNAMVEIANTDPRLFAATLADSNTSSASST